MGCSDILTSGSCLNQLSILLELNSFRDYLLNFDYDSVIEELQNNLIDNRDFIFGDNPDDEFKTMRGIQDYVKSLENRINDIISGVSSESIDWEQLIDEDDEILDGDIIKNSTSILDALVKINNYLNYIQNIVNSIDLSVNEEIERVIFTQSVSTRYGNIPITVSIINDLVGTPSVELETINGVVNIKFKNIKGLQGIQGPKGDTGNTGDRGLQGPKGDTVVLGNELTYTLYNTSGDNTDGAMTQAATTEYMDNRFIQVESIEQIEQMSREHNYNSNTFYYTIEEEEE